MTTFLRTAIALMTLLSTQAASAQVIGSPSCVSAMYGSLAAEHRFFRATLFGQPDASSLPIGSIRYDGDNNVWMKTDDNTWRSAAKGVENTPWRDRFVDTQGNPPPRRGIFETQKTPTSDLIPRITQSLRAFQCTLRARCMVAAQSAASKTKTISATPFGCKEITLPRLTACGTDDSRADTAVGTCEAARIAILNRETQMLELAVGYDAAYRSLLQFSGIMEGFLTDVRLPLLQPLWQTVSVMSGFKGLPCFSSECSE